MTVTQERPGDVTEAFQEAEQPDAEHTPVEGYGSAAWAYRAAGWRGPLPLPPSRKSPPPAGFTGHDGAWPSDEQIAEWANHRPANSNLLLRAEYGVIGIDVDAYGGKTGERTLNEAESRWGPLPPTFRSSARSDDTVSGIRLFQVPEGVLFRGGISFGELNIGGIEIIQPHHRGIVSWPSVNPKNSEMYRWYGPDGSLMPEGKVPGVEELPNLPFEWVEALSRDAVREDVFDGSAPNRMTAQRERINEEVYNRLVALQDDGPPDRVVSARQERAVADLTDGSGSRYDRMRDHVAGLMRLKAAGCVGVPRVLNRLYAAYVMEVVDTRPRVVAECEFLRFTEGAAALVASSFPGQMEKTVGYADDAPEVTHLRDRLLNVDQLRNLPPVKPLIDRLIYRDTLAQLAGPPGCYKSFAVTAMACAVATGKSFGSFVVPETGTVVYVAAEGANNLTARILAWCEVNGVNPEQLNERLRVVPVAVQLGNPVDVSEAVDLVQEIGADLLILDTRARCTVGLDENSATEQGKAIAAADRIRDAARCTVLGVHHSSRNGGAGRGSNAWDGAVWSDLRMESKTLLHATIKCEKHKDVASGCDHHFGLVRHTVSAELMPGTLGPERETLVLSGNPSGIGSFSVNSQKVVLEIIRNTAPPEGLSRTEITTFAKEVGVGQSAVYKAVNALVTEGHLDQLGAKNRSRYVVSGVPR